MELPKNDRDFANGQPIGLRFGKARTHEPDPLAGTAKGNRLRKALWLVAALGLAALAYVAGGSTGLIVLASVAAALLAAAVGWGIWITNNVQY